ncbi:FtsH protease activity modulator HflK [Limibacillus halophilus]
MPWQSQGGGGGGPWGGGGGSGNGGGPWGGGGGGNRGGGNNPWGGGNRGGGGQQPPDIEDLIRKGQDRVKRMLPGGMGSGLLIALLIAGVLVIWLVSGFYRVLPEQQGVELKFGKWDGQITSPGLNWNLPYPLGQTFTPAVERINSIEIGFTSVNGRVRDVAEESLMLTGDQNIIDIDFSVQWRIANAGEFLFNLRDPEATVKIAAESAMREVIGQTDIQPALTEARSDVENRTRTLLQDLLNEYTAGILVTEVKLQNVQPPQAVIDAFNDVQRALQDRDRQRNEAEAYRNDILPKARGEAQQMLQQAEAYRERVINEAEGEAQRFREVYDAYSQAPEVTRKRIYIETMQEILSKTDKVLLGEGSGGNGAIQYLPLDQLRNRSTGTPSGSGSGSN